MYGKPSAIHLSSVLSFPKRHRKRIFILGRLWRLFFNLLLTSSHILKTEVSTWVLDTVKYTKWEEKNYFWTGFCIKCYILCKPNRIETILFWPSWNVLWTLCKYSLNCFLFVCLHFSYLHLFQTALFLNKTKDFIASAIIFHSVFWTLFLRREMAISYHF